MMKRVSRAVLVLIASTALGACGGAAVGGPSISQSALSNPNYARLQFDVGTANIYGASQIGLNVVATFRQPSGASATGVNTPSLTGPFGLAAHAAPAVGSLADPYTSLWFSPNGGTLFLEIGGPSLPEKNGTPPAITGTLQSLTAGTPPCDAAGHAPVGFTACAPGIKPNATTFGQSGGVFAMGLAPYNIVASAGQSYSYAPYAQPLYDDGSLPLFVPWGGPPAFDPDGNGMGTRDGLIVLGSDSFGQSYELGVPEGITAWSGIVPRTGNYTLAIQIGVIGNNGSQNIITVAQTAHLGTLRKLSTLTAPKVTPDPSGDGGATFDAVLPGDVGEALVQIVDYGPGGGPTKGSSSGFPIVLTAPNCQGPKGTSFAPVYYSVYLTHSQTVVVGTRHGPNTNLNGGQQNLTPSPTICTAAQNNAAGAGNAGDNFTVQMIGFDYPLYAAALSLTQGSVPQAPPIAGPGGQSDITISAPIEEDWTPSGYTRTTQRAMWPRRTVIDSGGIRYVVPRAPRTDARAGGSLGDGSSSADRPSHPY